VMVMVWVWTLSFLPMFRCCFYFDPTQKCRPLQAVEIRELIIRCLSQMVLARVNNVKSGWKSVFMVFTTAAGEGSSLCLWHSHWQHCVRAAFMVFTTAAACQRCASCVCGIHKGSRWRWKSVFLVSPVAASCQGWVRGVQCSSMLRLGP
jgi:hypothetical protein